MHTISPNYPHTKSYIQAAPPITEAQLPYSLTREYQMLISNIQSIGNKNTGEQKETGNLGSKRTEGLA